MDGTAYFVLGWAGCFLATIVWKKFRNIAWISKEKLNELKILAGEMEE
jgi:hypothetical protein